MGYDIIISKAKEALENSYSPYSNFSVGSVLETTDDEFYLGTNIENASYGATMCAERSAIFSAISQGVKPSNFKRIAIVSNMDEYIPPCGLCRQVMVEFLEDNAEVLMVNKNGDYVKTTVGELVPHKFTQGDLGNV